MPRSLGSKRAQARKDARPVETPIFQHGAKPKDLRAQELARETGSSRIGEIRKAEGEKTRKSGVGEVRRHERRAEILEEGKVNRVAHRLMFGKKTSI